MGTEGTLGMILLLITGLTTYKGLKDQSYFSRFAFNVDGILVNQERNRLFTSGLLHADWIHFGFNMIALLSFSGLLEHEMHVIPFLLTYVGALLGGNLLALYIHRNHGDYTAVGASGAVSGVVFATIILFPNGHISFLLLPIEIKSWLFALLFVLISIFGIKSQQGRIGHEAHLGGALTGILFAILFQPTRALDNWWVIALLIIPILFFLAMIVRNPAILLIDGYWGFDKAFLGNKEEPTLDYLLDKIRRKGIESLTKRERDLLKKYRDQL